MTVFFTALFWIIAAAIGLLLLFAGSILARMLLFGFLNSIVLSIAKLPLPTAWAVTLLLFAAPVLLWLGTTWWAGLLGLVCWYPAAMSALSLSLNEKVRRDAAAEADKNRRQ